MGRKSITVVGAGYTGLTTAAELTIRGFKVRVVAEDLGYRPPLTIVGTQVDRISRDHPSNSHRSLGDGLDPPSVTRPSIMTIFLTRS